MHPGETIRFALLDSGSKDADGRLKIADLLEGDEEYDTAKYVEFLCRMGETLLQPLGYDRESIARLMSNDRP